MPPCRTMPPRARAPEDQHLHGVQIAEFPIARWRFCCFPLQGLQPREIPLRASSQVVTFLMAGVGDLALGLDRLLHWGVSGLCGL